MFFKAHNFNITTSGIAALCLTEFIPMKIVTAHKKTTD